MGLGRMARNVFELDFPEDILAYDYYYDGYGIEYRRIKGHYAYYVSSDGDVISFQKGRPRVLKTWKNQHGHKMTRIEGVFYLVHRLVAEAFIPNFENYPVVRHLDDCPENNSVDNLSWGTQKDNRMDCVRNGNDFRKGVRCIEDQRYFRSCASAADYYGVARSEITNACKGKVHRVKGKHFCYEIDYDENVHNDAWLDSHSPYKPVVAIDSQGRRYSFRSRREAAKELGIPNCGISSVLSGHLKHTYGWRFEEGE